MVCPFLIVYRDRPFAICGQFVFSITILGRFKTLNHTYPKAFLAERDKASWPFKLYHGKKRPKIVYRLKSF